VGGEDLSILRGAMIVGVTTAEVLGDEWTVLVVQTVREKFTVAVSRDAEGNGPGHLFVEPVDPAEELSRVLDLIQGSAG